ncbi:MAG: HAD-IA family hydrolase [Gaiellales bacterium]
MNLVTNGRAGFPRTWLFDFDGTLVDSVELILDSFRHATATVLGSVPDDRVLMAGVGTPLREQMRSFDAGRADELTTVYREHNALRHADLLRPYPGVDAMLAGLRLRGCRLGIVTSKMRDAVELGMRYVPLGDFDAVVTCDDTDRHKPDPAPVLHALALLDAPAAGAVYVGDAPYDVRAGRGAGVATAAAMWGDTFPADVLRAERPDRELGRPEEALRW